MTNQANLIGSAQVAQILGKDRSVVNKLAKAGRIPVVGKIDNLRGAYIFDRCEVEKIAARNSGRAA